MKKGMSLDEALVKDRADRSHGFSAEVDTSEAAVRRQIARGDATVRRVQAMFVVREPEVYGPGSRESYFADLIRSQKGLHGSAAASERLRRHAQDVETYPEFRGLDRTDGAGGHFVPPSYLIEEYVALARAGRPYANLVQTQDLGLGISSIEIPKVRVGTTTAMQTADNAPVAEQDLEDMSVGANVKTNAGQQDVAIQLLDQSPVNFDEIIFQDLYADYATKIDRQVLAGTNANGQVMGVHNTPGIQSIVLAGGLTVAKFYAAVADAIQRIHTTRHLPAQHIVMHPRRWAWLTSTFDNAGRPLSAASNQSPVNAVASLGIVTSEGLVGSMQGVPVIVDPNIGTTYGPGNNEDLVYVQRSSDLILLESSIRSRVLNEVGAKSLTVGLQVFGYIAFSAERYPQSVVEISGLPTPVFG